MLQGNDANVAHADAATADQEKLSYTVIEAVQLTGFSRADLYRAFGAKELTARKRGRKTVILADELRRFLSSLPAGKFAPPQGTARRVGNPPRVGHALTSPSREIKSPATRQREPGSDERSR